jgi:hypothetical protein
MTLLRKRDNPEYKYTLAFLGYGELRVAWGPVSVRQAGRVF